MTSIIDQMTQLYYFVDDALKANPRLADWRSSPNAHPAFTDAEVLTVALMQDCFGVASLQQTYILIAENFASAFPHLCSYQQVTNRSQTKKASLAARPKSLICKCVRHDSNVRPFAS